MNIRRGTIRNVPVVALVGELDRANAMMLSSLPSELAEAVDSANPRRFVDLSALTFADSSIIALLYDVLRTTSTGWLGIIGASPGVLRVLSLGGLLDQPQVKVFSDRDEAASAV